MQHSHTDIRPLLIFVWQYHYIIILIYNYDYTLSRNSDMIYTTIYKRFYWPFTCQPWHIGHFIYLHFFVRFFMRRKSVIRSVVIIPRFWTVWVAVYVCTIERYRPQRDSNLVPPASESTTLPMSDPGATYVSPFNYFFKYIENRHIWVTHLCIRTR